MSFLSEYFDYSRFKLMLLITPHKQTTALLSICNSRPTCMEQSSCFCPSIIVTGCLQTTAENSPVFYCTLHCIIHGVSKKLCQLIFSSLSVKYEPISLEIVRIVPEETLITKLCLKCPLHLKYVLALPWEI